MIGYTRCKKGSFFSYQQTTYIWFLLLLSFGMRAKSSDIFQLSQLPRFTPITSEPTSNAHLFDHPTFRPTQDQTTSMIERNHISSKPSNHDLTKSPTQSQITSSSYRPTTAEKNSSMNPSSSPTVKNTSSLVSTESRLSVIPSRLYSLIPTASTLIKHSDRPLHSPATISTHFPSRINDHQPSLLPTTGPSKSSEQLSLLPTIKQTSFPSEKPSNRLPVIDTTALPSRISSDHPSLLTTMKPTAFPRLASHERPSTFPSEINPTAFLSRKPSHRPSSLPTRKRTAFPSRKSNDRPSILPTVMPTSFQSRLSSGSPFLLPTLKQTKFPTKSSDHPSRQPTSNQIPFPRKSSDRPSLLPSKYKPRSTKVPSTKPSSHSYHPSQLPTESTFAANHLPTPIPTSTCHDSKFYHNPLTGKSCDYHNNTNCFFSKNMGLTDSQLDELLSSCPISCRVPCNLSWSTSDIVNVDVYLSNTTGFMSTADRGVFSTLALNFIDHQMKYSTWNNSVHITFIFVADQKIFKNTNQRSLWSIQGSRSLLGQFLLNVSLSVSFLNETPNINKEMLKKYISSTLADQTFVNNLREQDEYFVGVTIATSVNSTLPNSTRSRNKSKVILMATMLPLLVMLLLVFACAAFRRSKSKAHLRSVSFRQTTPKFMESYMDDQESHSSYHPRYQSALANDFAISMSFFTTRSSNASDHSTKKSPSLHESPQSLENSHVAGIPLQESTLSSHQLVPPVIVIDSSDDNQSNIGSETSSKNETWFQPPNISRMHSTPDLASVEKHSDRENRLSMYDFLL